MNFGIEKTGTTILALSFNEGIILAADTRTSMGTYVSNRVSNKITCIANNIYCCRSGSAADTQMIANIMKQEIKKIEVMTGKLASVYSAAKICSKLIYNYDLLAGMIIAGYDENGFSIYQISLGGSLFKSNWAIGGSGSAYIYGLIDSEYKEGMCKNEAIEFAKICVACAISRDNSSGGGIRIAVILENSIERDNFFC
ncbi:putative proteasome subunit beta type-1 [Dictyocoela muelleri]|nr:putative proteasome subunit beta type-1 [Dictyocoela muelleri]